MSNQSLTLISVRSRELEHHERSTDRTTFDDLERSKRYGDTPSPYAPYWGNRGNSRRCRKLFYEEGRRAAGDGPWNVALKQIIRSTTPRSA
jgi:hypothetical protein